MDTEKLNYFKEKLEIKKQHILDELSAVALKNQVTGEFEPKYSDISDDSDDNLQERINFERDLYVEDSLENSLKQIERALERIKDGTYGIDINSRTPIPEERLEILPEAENIV